MTWNTRSWAPSLYFILVFVNSERMPWTSLLVDELALREISIKFSKIEFFKRSSFYFSLQKHSCYYDQCANRCLYPFLLRYQRIHIQVLLASLLFIRSFSSFLRLYYLLVLLLFTFLLLFLPNLTSRSYASYTLCRFTLLHFFFLDFCRDRHFSRKLKPCLSYLPDNSTHSHHELSYFCFWNLFLFGWLAEVKNILGQNSWDVQLQSI